MPTLPFTQLIAAGAIFDPLTEWIYQYIPVGGIISVCHNATAVGLLCTFSSGSDLLMEESPVPAGGTAGVLPTPFNAPVIADEVAAGDRIKLKYRNPTGGGITVNGQIDFTG